MIYLFIILVSLVCSQVFIKNRREYFIPIFAFAVLFLVPSISTFILFSTIQIAISTFTKQNQKKLKPAFYILVLYSLVFFISSYGSWNSFFYEKFITLVYKNFLIIALCSIFIKNLRELRILLFWLTLILFFSYVIIGFYQFYTGDILVKWINEDSIMLYTQAYDLNRLRSFLEMHPANSANGILFIVSLTLYNSIGNKKMNYIILFITVFALYLTFTRASWVTFIFILLFYIKNKYSSFNYKLYLNIISVLILFYFIYIFFISNFLKNSVRIYDESNLTYRLEFWAYFFDNIDKYIFGVGYLNPKAINPLSNISFENYFIQEFVNFGLFGVFLYIVLFYYFVRNIKCKFSGLIRYKNMILLMMISFILNMMLCTYSEHMFFLLIGLSFSFNNVVKRYRRRMELINKIPVRMNNES